MRSVSCRGYGLQWYTTSKQSGLRGRRGGAWKRLQPHTNLRSNSRSLILAWLGTECSLYAGRPRAHLGVDVSDARSGGFQAGHFAWQELNGRWDAPVGSYEHCRSYFRPTFRDPASPRGVKWVSISGRGGKKIQLLAATSKSAVVWYA